VGVTMLSIVRGIEPFRMTTLFAAVMAGRHSLPAPGGCPSIGYMTRDLLFITRRTMLAVINCCFEGCHSRVCQKRLVNVARTGCRVNCTVF
jgi:hypothetical protein